jgi:methylthioribulose-1-phosphate dehydratase
MDEIIEAGRLLYARGQVPATSGNLSARLGAERVAITASGRHKGLLRPEDVLVVDLEGRPVGSEQRPSAETLLHLQLYRRSAEVGAVLHTHSLPATLLSRLAGAAVELAGYELLKALRGIGTHDTRVVVPVFPNTQDIAALARQVDEYMARGAAVWGYLIGGHGFYTWGRDMQEALRHLEAFEFLFECELRARGAVRA